MDSTSFPAPAPAAAPLAALTGLPPWEELSALDDGDLVAGERAWIAAQRRASIGVARFAAEIARRSSPGHGHAGLAQREGARTPEQFLERLAGVSAEEARALVRVGELLASDAGGGSSPVADGVASGQLSILAADAIRVGLGEASEAVSADHLAGAAAVLVTIAGEMPVRRVAAQARALRDQLDAAGIVDREQHRFERRFLRVTAQPDGMTRLTGLLDPESAAVVVAAFDEVTSPRRGGPRFVDPVAAEHSRRLVDDSRTNEQLLADTFVDLVRIAGAADPGQVFVQRRPAVQIRVDLADLETGRGVARIDGQTSAVSVATARRHVCSSGSVAILFDGSAAIDVGRSQRLHTVRQRTAIAARDRGCRAEGCDRPPSWCEVHHPEPWAQGGETSIANGILLCRFHHHRIHAQGWKVELRGGDYVAVPPAGSGRSPALMPAHL